MWRLFLLTIVIWGIATLLIMRVSKPMSEKEQEGWLFLAQKGLIAYQPGQPGHSLHRIVKALQNKQVLNIPNYQLSDYWLTGLPPELWQLQNLQELYISNLGLTSLPPELSQLQNLRVLALDSNQLKDVPPQVWQLPNLRVLYLSNNQLSSLPPEVGQLRNLQILSVANNQLSSLPRELDQLEYLQTLFFADNPLDIPSSISGSDAPGLIEYLRTHPHLYSDGR